MSRGYVDDCVQAVSSDLDALALLDALYHDLDVLRAQGAEAIDGAS